MNKDEWSKQPNRCSTYEYKYIHRLLNEWKRQNGIAKRCVVHHRDDNDEVKSYNELHYERWGLNPDGTFEYGKYVIFMTTSDHSQYHHKGKHHSEETKAKISESNKGVLKGEKHPMYGKRLSEETKAKMSNALKGENNSFFGKHHSEEAKEKMSQRTKERMQLISDAYKKYKLDGGTLTWYDFIKQYSNGGLQC